MGGWVVCWLVGWLVGWVFLRVQENRRIERGGGERGGEKKETE